MAEHDYSIANDTGANVRTDINNVLSAIVSNNSKGTEPTTKFAFMWWADTGNDLLKQRNAANNAWISILTLSTGVVASESVTLSNSVTLTNKTLTAPAVTNLTGTFNSPTGTIGAMTLGGAVTGGDNTVSAINLKDYGEVTDAKGSLGATPAFDLTAGNSKTGTVSEAITSSTFTNPTASDELCAFSLMLTNGGAYSVSWPTTVDWAGATAPTLTASGVDCLVFWTVDGGTIWNGSTVALDLG